MGVLRKRFFSVDESTGGFSLERFSVKAPAWAKPGDTIEIEAGTAGSRYMVTVPSSAGPGESFEVAVALSGGDEATLTPGNVSAVGNVISAFD